MTFQGLISLIPELGGLGINLNLDLGGQARFGRDAEWVVQIDDQYGNRRGRVFNIGQGENVNGH